MTDPLAAADQTSVSMAYEGLRIIQALGRAGTAAFKKHLAAYPHPKISVASATTTEYDAAWIIAEMERQNIPLSTLSHCIKISGAAAPKPDSPYAETLARIIAFAPQKQTNRYYLREAK